MDEQGTTGSTTAAAMTLSAGGSEVAVAILTSPDLSVVYANPAHTSLFGWGVGSRPATDPASAPTRTLPDLSGAVLAAAGSVLRDGEPVRFDEVAAGDKFLQVVCSPIRADSTTSGVTVITIDITPQVRARQQAEHRSQRLSVLDEATTAVTAEMEPRRELTALAESVVPGLADACAVYLVDRSPTMPAELLRATRLVCVIDPSLGIVPPAPEARVRLAPTRPVAQATRTGQAVLASGIEADPRGWGEHWLTLLDPNSKVAVPIGGPDGVLAVISFVAVGKRPQYQESDIALMRELTARASVAVGHALRLQHASEVALALQRGLLTEPPELPGLGIRVRYRPAGPGMEIGGDWYDAFALPRGGLALTVGDVVGHDLYAASTMGQLRSMVQALACQPGAEPAGVLTGLNALSTHLGVGEFATAVHGHLTPPSTGAPATFTWANAGHPPPLLIGPGGSRTVLERPTAPLLGLVETGYQQHRVELPPEAVLLLYTDGLMEDPERPRADAVAELADLAAEHAAAGLDVLCDRLIASAPTRDDIALVAIQAGRVA